MNLDANALPTDGADTIRESDVVQAYLTQANGPVVHVAVPDGQDIVRIPVTGGETIQLPFPADDLGARLGDDNGNLAIQADGTTVILLGYTNATAENPIEIVGSDGDQVDVASVLASTDPNLDIQTAAGAAAGDLGTLADNTGGVFAPFDPATGLGGFEAIGGLAPTALNYATVQNTFLLYDPQDLDTPLAPGNGGGTGTPPINYNDANAVEENIERDTNVMVVLDISGSMKEDANSAVPGVQDRFSIAKAALADLLHTYDNLGDVRVSVVTFFTGAEIHFSWGDVADALASLDTLTPKDLTNYAAALDTAADAWVGGGKLSGDVDNVIYFLSDGKPTAGGGPGNHLTAAQKADWDSFLEDPANGIDHVHVVGIGDKIGTDASPDSDLTNVAHPDGDNLPPGDVIYITDPLDLATGLIHTVEGEKTSGNVLSGVDTSGIGDNGTPGQADTAGEGATHIQTFSYDGNDNAFDVQFSWDGVAADVTKLGAGQNVMISGREISFDTEHGRMTFDFDSGDYTFTPGAVSADTSVTFHYGTQDAAGNVDAPGGTDADGPAGGADLVISIDNANVPVLTRVADAGGVPEVPAEAHFHTPPTSIDDHNVALVTG